MLLDRYVQRIDALVPEDMEHLVRPLSWKPPMQRTTRSLKLTVPEEVRGGLANITEADIRDLLEPLQPTGVVVGWLGREGEFEVYVQFETHDECREGRLCDSMKLKSEPVKIRFTVDEKFEAVQDAFSRENNTRRSWLHQRFLKQGAPEPPLPVGWEKQWSEEHQTHYFWNPETDESTWETPEEWGVDMNEKEGTLEGLEQQEQQ